VVADAGRRSRAKSGTEGSGRRAEGIEAGVAGQGELDHATRLIQLQRPGVRAELYNAMKAGTPPLWGRIHIDTGKALR